MDAHELMLRRSQYICVLALVNARFSILKKQKPLKLNLSPGVVLYVPIFKIRRGTVLKYGKLFNNIHKCYITLLCLLGKRFEIAITQFICDIPCLFVRGGLEPSNFCLLYTSPSPRDLSTSRMPSSA